MSGDVQPRKRKDKKRKRDDDESSHGVHSTKMGSDDVHLHIQEEHGTGGHWCAKILFFILLAVLVGLIGLIIMENRGLTDLDEHVAESRYSTYFDGWVEESIDDHDDHNHIDVEHEEDHEQLEAEEDHSELDVHDENDHEDEDEDEAADDEEKETADDEDDDTEDGDDEDNVEIDEDAESNEATQTENKSNDDDEVDLKDDNNDEDAEENQNTEEEDHNNENDEENDDKNDNEAQDDDANDNDEKPLDDDEENAIPDSVEEVVDNEEKAADETATEAGESWTTTLAVKIGIGVALALVARLVLIKKNPTTLEEEINNETLMKRRLTIATAQDEFTNDEDIAILPNDDEEYSEEEIVIEEEVEIECDVNDEDVKPTIAAKEISRSYMPETFEDLNAQFKPKSVLENEIEIGTSSKQLSAEKLDSRNINATREEAEEEDVGEEEYEEEEDGSEEENLGEDEDIEYEEGDEISDVDDTDLMKRLDAKYGSLRTTEEEDKSNDEVKGSTWTQINQKNNMAGPQMHHDDNNDDDDIDDEVDFNSFEKELRKANEEMMRERYQSALRAFKELSKKYPDKPEVILGEARVLDELAEKLRSNKILQDALKAYKRYLNFGQLIPEQKFREVAEQCIKRMRFMGLNWEAIPIHKQLMQRFSNEPSLRNDLVVTYLHMNRMAEAKLILKETLRHWPDNGFALVHYGFVLKQHDLDYKNAVVYLKRGIDTAEEGTQDGRFFFNLGDALLRLGRHQESLEIYKKGADLGLFPSVYQRSLYNEANLRAQPFWSKKETTYDIYLDRLQRNWQAIRDEGLHLLSKHDYFQDESENLRDKGKWKQFELYARGQKVQKHCQKAPITCSLITNFPAARDCRRGQVKFSVMHADTHVWPHCGPTNCRLRAHLGLVVPQGARIRVAEEERVWKEGEFLIFDDSFEHEVWHNGNSTRLVLIVDMWHPDLSNKQRQQLAAI